MKRLLRILPPFLLSFLSGVFVASIDTPPLWFLVFLSAFSFIFLIMFLYKRNRMLPALLFISLGLIIGIERYAIWELTAADPVILDEIGTVVSLEGVVVAEPDVREDKTHLAVAITVLDHEGRKTPVQGKALIIVNRFPEYHYGDMLKIDGKLTVPQMLTEDDGRTFDYPKYLRSKGIRFQMLFPKLSLVREGEGNALVGRLYGIKEQFEHALTSALPAPESALLSGLLLGGKQSLGSVWLERFRVAGVIHIIVLSGYNMTIVAEWLVVMFRSLGFYGSLSVGSIGIILFALMTGGGATVLRAAIMALIVLLAKATGRNYDMSRALLVAAALMVAQNPSILLHDPSFQLSFLASIGLIYVSPIIEKRTKLFHSFPMLREVFVSTLATQVVVLPLLLFQTGMLSLVALPANLIVLPLIPITMFTGFIAGVTALVSPTVGIFVALPAEALLAWILLVAEYAERIPFAAIRFSSIPAYMVCFAYIIMFMFVHYEDRITPRIIRLWRARKAPPSN